MVNSDDNPAIGTATPPQNILQASVDEKGRLKVPADAQEYLEAAGVTKVFITSLDMQLARIYPMELWNHNLKVFQNARENSAAAQRIAFLARAHGGEAELDKGGRFLLPAKLREALDLEKQAVWLEFHNGGINILTRPVYDERMRSSKAHLADDLQTLERLGLL